MVDRPIKNTLQIAETSKSMILSDKYLSSCHRSVFVISGKVKAVPDQTFITVKLLIHIVYLLVFHLNDPFTFRFSTQWCCCWGTFTAAVCYRDAWQSLDCPGVVKVHNARSMVSSTTLFAGVVARFSQKICLHFPSFRKSLGPFLFPYLAFLSVSSQLDSCQDIT